MHSAFLCRRLTSVILMVLLARTISACPELSSAPHSQWKVETQNGVHWLLTPCGERFFSIGLNALNDGPPAREMDGRIHYHWGLFYPNFEAWLRMTRARVQAWGFNTAGGWSLHPHMLKLPVIPNLELGRLAQFHWFDPFHPFTEEQMRAQAHLLVAPYKNNPYRIGYFSDNEVGWWNGALFTHYIKQPETNYTKRKLVSLLREYYGNDWSQFSRDFLPPPDVVSFDDLLHNSGAITHLRVGGVGIQVVRRWTGIVAEHYYRLVHSALREADPEALIFADRLPIYYDPAAVRTMAPYVDVIATNYDVDSPDGWIARYYFEGIRQLTGNKPVLISEWFFAAHENRTGNRNNGHLMTVQRQDERAKGAAAAAKQFARQPGIVGIHWFQFYDYPRGGRADGEDYNFGLVDIDDQPYEELVEALSQANPTLPLIHQDQRLSAYPSAGTSPEIPEAEINAWDRSLIEWPKEQAMVPRFTAPWPEVVFGDVYIAWSRRGLHLATISMDYYDPVLLAYSDTFPRGEAFRIDWGLDVGSRPRHFAILVFPPKITPEKGALRMRAELCRADNAPCEPVSTGVATYFGSDTPRITLEVSLPWDALGVDAPPQSQHIRMELAMTSFHRARWMSWSGLPPAQAMQETARWSEVKLGSATRHLRPQAPPYP
jgi:hypothetical protein